jgi:3-oxo-5-alpha-steroid 4-dehydrogenase 1
MTINSYNILLSVEIILALLVFVMLNFISAPYGRFNRKGWGPSINSRVAWMVMESPALLFPIFLFLYSSFSLVSFVFLILWLSHYFHRAIIYPFRISDPQKPFSILIMLWGGLFNLLNGVVNFYYLFFIRVISEYSWFYNWKFLSGLTIFVIGFFINKKSDAILRKLRSENTKNYSIPSGGMYKWISAPNYLGEILEWGGWALLTWSLAGTAFFLFSIANLVPRAIMIHKWYKNNFSDYPTHIKAIIPFVY